MREPTVLVVGHVTHDRYGDEIVPGGCAYYAAQTYRALGASVRLKTTLGLDFSCDDALQKIAVSAERRGTTTAFTNLYPAGGIRVQRIEASALAVFAHDLPTAWRQVDLLHLSPVMGEVDLEHWLSADISARHKVIGTQGYIKEAGPSNAVVQRAWQPDPTLLRKLDAACVGEEDLIGQGDLLQRLCDAIPVVALTRGPAGCDVIVRGKTTRVGIFPTQERDPTGAGDTFAAGFFFAIAQGQSPADAARLGAAAASIVVEGRGGETLPLLTDAFERARRIQIL